MSFSCLAGPLMLQRAVIFQSVLWYSKLRIFPQNVSVLRLHITLRTHTVYFRMQRSLSNADCGWSGQICSNYSPIVHVKIVTLLLLLYTVRYKSIVFPLYGGFRIEWRFFVYYLYHGDSPGVPDFLLIRTLLLYGPDDRRPTLKFYPTALKMSAVSLLWGSGGLL